ncbi:MAG: alpha-rhamnosidase [Kiritimatiellae bacterium]|nr:alpha-rhamnosidase [Kiritimatiellia bacterium]
MSLSSAAPRLRVSMLAILPLAAFGAGAQWIWYPGDREIALGSEVQMRRIEKGEPDCVIWPEYSPWRQVTFGCGVYLEKPETVRVDVEGDAYIFTSIDDQKLAVKDGKMTLPAGGYWLSARVYNAVRAPAIRIEGEHVNTDPGWKVRWSTCDQSDAAFAPDCIAPDEKPSAFRMALERRTPVWQKSDADGIIADFGRETFGFVILKNVTGAGKVRIVYGESLEEANAGEDVDVWEALPLAAAAEHRLAVSRAFRYIRVTPLEGDVQVGGLEMEYEYLPLAYRGAFRCSDGELNRIWDVAAYTLHLTTREFFLDGIKRDRWVWSGDARQSAFMDYYLFADGDVVKRTLCLLGGKDPISSHVNTIMDYTLYWLMAVGEYYLYTGDAAFLKEIWPRVKAQTDFCRSLTDRDGFIVDRPGDWVFIDWTPEPVSKNGGACAFEQILFAEALKTSALVAQIAGDDASGAIYLRESETLRRKIVPAFWSEKDSALLSFKDGKTGELRDLTRYPNMFGLFYKYFDPATAKRIVDGVILNDGVMRITTPYMQYYELESLCSLGMQQRVTRRIKDYWGGMLALGATSFWEYYDANETGSQHYAMYGRPFGKSLCHAWGASPVYLFGRYYLGVEPTAPGFSEYEVKPNLGGLDWMEGSVPAPFGEIKVSVKDGTVRVRSSGGKGTLILPSGKRIAIPPHTTLTAPF